MVVRIKKRKYLWSKDGQNLGKLNIIFSRLFQHIKLNFWATQLKSVINMNVSQNYMNVLLNHFRWQKFSESKNDVLIFDNSFLRLKIADIKIRRYEISEYGSVWMRLSLQTYRVTSGDNFTFHRFLDSKDQNFIYRIPSKQNI